MPNWCFTSFVVKGDPEQRQDLYEKMKALDERKDVLIPNGFGITWLGNLVTVLNGNWEDVYCRGHYFDLRKDDNVIRFSTETAWSYPDEVISFINTVYPDLIILFMSEEPGMGLYFTNDAGGEFFPDRYILEVGDEDPEYYSTDDEGKLLSDVGKLVGKKLNTVDEAIAAACEYNDDKDWEESIQIRVYEVI